jgi:hypothetical protein
MALPKCQRCGGGSPRVLSIRYRNPAGEIGYRQEWVCATCEYVAAFPDGPVILPPPRERKPKSLQREALFGIEAVAPAKGTGG